MLEHIESPAALSILNDSGALLQGEFYPREKYYCRDRRFNANVLSANYNALQVQLSGSDESGFIPSRFQADDTHWPVGCG